MKKNILFSCFTLATSFYIHTMEKEIKILDEYKQPPIPLTENKLWKELPWLNQEIKLLEDKKNKNFSREERNDIKGSLAKGATFRGCMLFRTYPEHKTEIDEQVKKTWNQLTKDQRTLIASEMYGLVDEYDIDPGKSDYEIIVQAAHRKIENARNAECKALEEKALKSELGSVEQQLLELLKKQKSVQSALETAKAYTELIGFANTYLTSKQESFLKATKQKIQQTDVAIRQLDSSLTSLNDQLDKENNLEERTKLRAEIEKQKEQKTTDEKALSKLETTKVNMKKRIESDNYTWTDYTALRFLSSRKQ